MVRHALLVCGIVAPLHYVAINIYVPTQWDAYGVASQTVSELSAIGAPTRALWVWLVVPYSVLLTAFGIGVWTAGAGSRSLRVAAAALIAHGFLGLYWPPMHLRGAIPQTSLTDTLHIVWAAMTLLLMLVAIGFGVLARGRQFRIYSALTVAVFVVFGTLAGLDGPRIARDLPTPWIGVWERINIAAFMLWLMVFTAAFLRATPRDSASIPKGRDHGTVHQ